MSDELKVGGVCLLTGLVAGMMLTVMITPHPREQALKIDLKASEQARAVEAEGAAITAASGQKAEARAVHIRTVTREIVRRVPQILPPDVAARYPLPAGFVRLHDAAARGDLPATGGPAAQPDDAPSAVTAADAAAVITGNYGSCSETAARLSALQDWVRAQQALMNGDTR
ncbi:hypothetical protein [Asticcacaulis solisilvae]|uniref:hypothetical protein n=1 Tax=Asticcacaulis solisilvae TaxID=1217274 RepID=UPI003FD7FE84